MFIKDEDFGKIMDTIDEVKAKVFEVGKILDKFDYKDGFMSVESIVFDRVEFEMSEIDGITSDLYKMLYIIKNTENVRQNAEEISDKLKLGRLTHDMLAMDSVHETENDKNAKVIEQLKYLRDNADSDVYDWSAIAENLIKMLESK